MTFGKETVDFRGLVHLLIEKIIRIPLSGNPLLYIIQQVRGLLDFNIDISEGLYVPGSEFALKSFKLGDKTYRGIMGWSMDEPACADNIKEVLM